MWPVPGCLRVRTVTFYLASRGSALALWQAEHVRNRIRQVRSDIDVDIRVVKTTGDRITDVPLSRLGGRGVFTKEVDNAVLAGEAAAAVHSLKDLPTVMADGLVLGAVLAREDPHDAYVPGPGRAARLDELPAGSRVGTSSLRRRAQLLGRRPDLEVVDLRGNLDTRLRHLADGRYDAIIVAAAGLRRLGREDVIGEILDSPTWLPAVGQGALAVVIRDGDSEAAAVIRLLDDAAARAETGAERAFLRALEGGCQVPIGALGRVHGSVLELHGMVSDLEGRTIMRGSITGTREEAEALGRQLAAELLDRGAGPILEEIRGPGADAAPPAAP